ncbi:MAG TPA: S1/P1 nuclease [Isosphaeraceae bacterium]|nr:S1/P1 nuclease [Isosphaeraceae bacterium]
MPRHPKSRFRRPLAGLLLALLASSAWLIPPTQAWAWGRLGHRTSAILAESLLTPSARAAVRDLLEPGETLADAATWADEIRRERRRTSPWHYVDVPISEDHYNPRYSNPKNGHGCVVDKVKEMRRILADSSLPRAERREALRFFVHFVQDVHQPLHVGENHDKGGNDLQVRFFNRGSNLHRVWDSGLIEKSSDDPIVWVNRLKVLATPENVEKWSGGVPEDWAEESFQAARTHAYRNPSSGNPLVSGATLGNAYQQANLPIAETRLAQSGVRVAAALNSIFP